jgi:hypothetical protein
MRGNEADDRPRKMIWSGRVLVVLTASFIVLLIACTLIYLILRTSILGAVLLTGYLGGAVASNVRAGYGWFETLFPMLFVVLVWGGLGMRDACRALLTSKETTLVTEHQVFQARQGEPDPCN